MKFHLQALSALILAPTALAQSAGSKSTLHDKLTMLYTAAKDSPTDEPALVGSEGMVYEVDKAGTAPSLKAERHLPKPKEASHLADGPLTIKKDSSVLSHAANLHFSTGDSDQQQCEDLVEGWHDADGPTYTCAWYAAFSHRCELFGDYAENFGYTANEACCTCGGGGSSPTTGGDNGQCSDTAGWTDSWGDGCSWYEADADYRCSNFGDGFANAGQTANDACCICGGGTTESGPEDPVDDGQCNDTPGWTDSAGDGCAWYEANADFRCSTYGGGFASGGQTANDACCVCGGGSDGSGAAGGSGGTGTGAGGTGNGAATYGNQASCGTNDSGAYNMCLDLRSESGTVQPWMDAFIDARDVWESVIVGDLGSSISSSGLNTGPEFTCTGYPTQIDDSYICGTDADIDGPGGVLGSAGPRYVRSTGVTNPKTGSPFSVALSGFMRFDVADINRLIEQGSFQNVILHEMGHVLGIGSLWELNGLYSGSGVYADDTHAQDEWEAIGCTGPLPVETDGGQGTADSHWDETCLDDELMTGALSGTEQPMSRITIGTLEDMGYVVDYSQADPFSTSDLGFCGSSCPGARRLRASSRKTKAKKPLSEEGRAAVLSYAKSEFHMLSKDAPTELPEGVAYVAADMIDVLYEDEDGEISIVKVSRREADEFA